MLYLSAEFKHISVLFITYIGHSRKTTYATKPKRSLTRIAYRWSLLLSLVVLLLIISTVVSRSDHQMYSHAICNVMSTQSFMVLHDFTRKNQAKLFHRCVVEFYRYLRFNIFDNCIVFDLHSLLIFRSFDMKSYHFSAL